MRASFNTRPSGPGVFSTTLSNPPGDAPAACTVRVSERKKDDRSARDPQPGPEMERSAYQRMEQVADAEPKGGR